MICKAISSDKHMPKIVRVPWVRTLPPTSSRSHLTVDTLSLASGW
ncbi:hypothetical protein CLOSPI_02315 [Thomasclavelia spiroformis DSM 1552]|uniref:Uncharacterized protein n=1 Tax=Thomasclavelia spiroformis DSM 1552 TaxID=428126 RepID=B1C5E6_9FIRM|nr:hypothetical protein CLOSPI_02315 [Thomasclavelia spiroformis DSM 1552]